MVGLNFLTAAIFGAKPSRFQSRGIFHLNDTGKLLFS